MHYLRRDEDTICAISTARGRGGISIIRVSGEGSEAIVRHLCPFLPHSCESHRIYYGFIRDYDLKKEIDEVLVSYFAKGRSFTGETTLEISSHGSDFISQRILLELQRAGARMAEKGEFTYRSFMNGRMDLVQAEGVLAMIESESQTSARLALKQLRGRLSQAFTKIKDKLLWILAHLEAHIDFSLEDIPHKSEKELLDVSLKLQEEIQHMLSSYKKGCEIRNGVNVSIVGEPNVGKSSLLNVLLGADRAIVSDHAGTTRDCVEGRLFLEGVVYNLTDTAGLRDSSDEIENMGIERSLKSIEDSDVVFLVFDLTKAISSTGMHIKKLISENMLDKLYLVFNKLDIASLEEQSILLGERKKEVLERLRQETIFNKGRHNENKDSLRGHLKNSLGDKNGEESIKRFTNERSFCISALNSFGIEDLLGALKNFAHGRYAGNSTIIAHARHFELLRNVNERLEVGNELLRQGSSFEFVAFEFQEGLVSIQKLLGKQYDDEVMDKVFQQFCLGK